MKQLSQRTLKRKAKKPVIVKVAGNQQSGIGTRLIPDQFTVTGNETAPSCWKGAAADNRC